MPVTEQDRPYAVDFVHLKFALDTINAAKRHLGDTLQLSICDWSGRIDLRLTAPKKATKRKAPKKAA